MLLCMIKGRAYYPTFVGGRLLEVILNFVCLYSFYVKPDHIESTNIDCYVSPIKWSLLETDKKCILRLTDKQDEVF